MSLRGNGYFNMYNEKLAGFPCVFLATLAF